MTLFSVIYIIIVLLVEGRSVAALTHVVCCVYPPSYLRSCIQGNPGS